MKKFFCFLFLGIFLLSLLSLLAACGGGSDSGGGNKTPTMTAPTAPPPAPTSGSGGQVEVMGRVTNPGGPVVGQTVLLKDGSGKVVAQAVTDGNGRYDIVYPTAENFFGSIVVDTAKASAIRGISLNPGQKQNMDIALNA